MTQISLAHVSSHTATLPVASIARTEGVPARSYCLGITLAAIALAACFASPASAQRVDRSRLRFGLSAVGGGFVGAVHGGSGGIAPRLGVQLNDELAIYVQGQGLLGRFTQEPGDSLTGFAFHSLVFEVAVEDTFMLGLGPSVDFIWGCDDPAQHPCADAGPYFGGNARFAVALGAHGPQRREGVVLSLDAHPTWFGGSGIVTILVGAGFELY